MEFLHVADGCLLRGTSPFLLRGFGLGGWLLPEGYMWKLFTKCDRPRRMEALISTLCGTGYAQSFWTRYFDTYVTESDFDFIAAHGFNSVRLPLNARHLCTRSDGVLSLDPAALRHVDNCVRWCRDRGLYVVLDMHAAPGGQTGQNIDDSENDLPELFLDERHADDLTALWTLLARRYRDEPAVAGYDLLNEPLPNWNARYHHLVLPLYRRLTAAIRAEDTRHPIILEGVHWATDFSVFDGLTAEETAREQYILQFHKYWSPPDADSLAPFLSCAARLNAALYMGEGGENNPDWYTAVFPLYERLGISWSFWSYKKMDNENSPVTFPRPAGWDLLIAHLDGGPAPGREEAVALFDGLLAAIAAPIRCEAVLRALSRTAPLSIPAEAFDGCAISSPRSPGADLRAAEPVTLLFADGHTGVPDYKRYGGEPQPESERILVRLLPGDGVCWRFSAPVPVSLRLDCGGDGTLSLTCGARSASFPPGPVRWSLPAGEGLELWARCTAGTVLPDRLILESEVDA